MFGNRYVPAITIKKISGKSIMSILSGTQFFVISEVYNKNGDKKYTPWDDSIYYRNCQGLGVSSVYLDEFKFL